MSLRWGPSSEYAQEKTVRLVVATGWALAGPALLIASDRDRTIKFIYIIAGFGMFAAVSTIFVEAGMISNPSANYLISGRVIGLGILVLAWFAFISENILQRIGAVVGLIISAVALVIGGGRTPFVATIVSSAILAGLLAVQRSQTKSVGRGSFLDSGYEISFSHWMFMGVVGVVSIIVAIAIFVIGIVPRTIVRLLSISTAPTSSFGQRLGYWDASIHEYPTAPIFGHGLGSWPAITPDVAVGYPHNIILEVGVELGLIGLVLLSVVVVFGLVSALRTMRNGTRPLSWLILILVGFMAVNALISGDLNDNRYLFAMIGLLITPAIGSLDQFHIDGWSTTQSVSLLPTDHNGSEK